MDYLHFASRRQNYESYLALMSTRMLTIFECVRPSEAGAKKPASRGSRRVEWSPWNGLEGDVGANLHTPLEVLNTGYLACGGLIDVVVWIGEIGAVESVEHIP